MSLLKEKDRAISRGEFWINGVRYRPRLIDPKTGEGPKNRTDAKRIQAILKARILEKKPVEPTHGKTTLAEALNRWRKTHDPEAFKARGGPQYIRGLIEFFGADRPITDFLDTDLIDEFIEWSKKQPKMIYIGGPKSDRDNPKNWKKVPGQFRSAATTNRYLDALRAALYVCHRKKDPTTGELLYPQRPEIRRLKEGEHKPRPIPLSVLRKIYDTGPEHLSKAVGLALIAGLRQWETLEIGPQHIDDAQKGIWIPPEMTKAERGELIPAGSEEAWQFLLRLRDEAKAAGAKTLVFYRTKKGQIRSIKSFKKAWNTALKKLNLDTHYTWHNTKASFVSLIVAKTTRNPKIIKERARHTEIATTMRYLGIDDPDIQESAEKGAQRLVDAGFDLKRSFGPPQSPPDQVPPVAEKATKKAA